MQSRRLARVDRHTGRQRHDRVLKVRGSVTFGADQSFLRNLPGFCHESALIALSIWLGHEVGNVRNGMEVSFTAQLPPVEPPMLLSHEPRIESWLEA